MREMVQATIYGRRMMTQLDSGNGTARRWRRLPAKIEQRQKEQNHMRGREVGLGNQCMAVEGGTEDRWMMNNENGQTLVARGAGEQPTL